MNTAKLARLRLLQVLVTTFREDALVDRLEVPISLCRLILDGYVWLANDGLSSFRVLTDYMGLQIVPRLRLLHGRLLAKGLVVRLEGAEWALIPATRRV